MSDRFKGKGVLLTGAASGIGRSVALRLAGEGGTVFGVDLDELFKEAEDDATLYDWKDEEQRTQAVEQMKFGQWAWQCLNSNCAAINLWDGDILSSLWHHSEVECRACTGKNRLVPKADMDNYLSTEPPVEHDYKGQPYTTPVRLLVAPTEK